jgi:hemerythrin-like metal-binding protein
MNSELETLAKSGAAGDPLPWLALLTTGDNDIDRQHRLLIEDANAVEALARARAPWPEVVAKMHDMHDRCIGHFATEDLTMQQGGITYRDAHRAAHRRILIEIHSMLTLLEAAAVPNRFHWELALSMRRILVDHLLREDFSAKAGQIYG